MKWHYLDPELNDRAGDPSFWDYYPPPPWSKPYTEPLSRALDAGLDLNAPWGNSPPDDFFDDPQLMGPVPRVKLTNPEAWGHYNTPLHHALYGSHYDIDGARLLLQRGADIDQLNSVGRTALHEAVLGQRTEVVRFLLEAGAGLDKRTVEAHSCVTEIEEELEGRSGELVWEYALWNSDVTILKMLLQAGTDVCGGMWTALDLAIWAGDERVAEALLEFDRTLIDGPLAWTRSEDADLARSSRELLKAVNSKALRPSDDLYAAYCSALQQAVASIKRDLTALALVDGFSSALRAQARLETQRTSSTILCSSCVAFQREALKRWDLPEDATLDITLHEDRASLDRSADGGCPSCCIIADTLDYMGEVWVGLDRREPSPAVIIRCRTYSVEHKALRAPWVTCGELSADLEVRFAEEAWADMVRGLDRDDRETRSDNAMTVARHWLHSCRESEAHEACRDAYPESEDGNTVLPKRLLHVGADNGPDPRIVETEGLSVKYVALSYCWGPSGFLITTHASLAQHMTSIPVHSLPQLLYDAVIVTRALQLDYIWIDALCIVQDDTEDWAAEAARMHDIYTYADITISTTVSSDCRTSLFTPRKYRSKHPVPLDWWVPRARRQPGKPIQVLEPVRPGEEQSGLGAVHTRAWTLQEQQMSTRILWFGDGGMSWECLNGVSTEAMPRYSKRKTGAMLPAYHFDAFAMRAVLKGLMLRGPNTPWNFGDASPFKVWQLLLEEYSRRRITHESDRLPAFMAVTNALTALSGCGSTHGVWLGEKMIPSLCWRAKSPSPNAKRKEMPSWLWAGLKAEVLFDLDRIIQTPNTRNLDSVACVNVVAVDTSTSLSLSQVTGSITIRGTLYKKGPLSASILASQEIPTQGFRDGGPEGKQIFLDEQVDSLEDCYTMPLLWYPHSMGPGGEYPEWPELGPPPLVIMILQKIGEGGEFRRVGIAVRYYLDSPFGVEEVGNEGVGEAVEDAYEWLDWHEEIYKDSAMTLV